MFTFLLRSISSSKHNRIRLGIVILFAYFLIGLFYEPAFVSYRNISTIFFEGAVILPAIIGTQLLLSLGYFDLSIGALAGLTAMITAIVLNLTGFIFIAVCVGLGVGVLFGIINGVLVTKSRINPLIATLAMMWIIRSLTLLVNNGEVEAGLPDSINWVINVQVLGIPLLILLAILFMCVIAFAANHTVILRRFYASGSNPFAASHAGVNVNHLIVVGYILVGVGAALTGAIQISRTLSASPTIFQTLALEAIAACIIGGSTLEGGRGSVLGASIGLIVLVATNNLVQILGIEVYWKELVIGLFVLIAVSSTFVVQSLQKLTSSLSKIKIKENQNE